MKTKTFHIPVFVPHKGCPHDCVFCNQRRITGQIEELTLTEAKDIIENNLLSIEKNNAKGSYYAEIAFFGGSFTAIDINQQTEFLRLAHSYVESGRVQGIRCSTRPDCIDEKVISNCISYGMTSIELGVQSADNDVLTKANRGHTFDDVIRASELIRSSGIELGLQMMTGLPGDSFSKSVETARKIASLKPDCVRIYPTLVMDGTHLSDMYKNGSYVPHTVDEAVELVSEIVPIFEDAHINILRIGLQTTDGVNASTVSGPYHPAFAELVYGRIFRKKLEKYIIGNNLRDTTVSIMTSKDKISFVSGHKKENKMYFKIKYNIDIKAVTNSDKTYEKAVNYDEL